jgi:hypothetical protein
MGSSQSDQSVLTQVMTKVISNVMVNVSSSGTGSSSQNQTVNIINTKNSNVNIDMTALSKISLNLLQSSSVNVSMQAQIVTAIMDKLSTMKTDFPQLSSSGNSQHIRNIITNEIQSNLNIESISKISLAINQDQSVNVINDENIVANIKGRLQADGLASLINTTSSDIAQKLIEETSTSSDVSSTQTNFLTDLTKSIFDGINKFFSVSAMAWIAVIVLVAIITYGGYKYLEANPNIINDIKKSMTS